MVSLAKHISSFFIPISQNSLVRCVLSTPNKLLILHVLYVRYVRYVSASETLPVVIPMSRDFTVAKKRKKTNRKQKHQRPFSGSFWTLTIANKAGNFELLSTRRPLTENEAPSS